MSAVNEPALSIVFPAYNEEERLGPTLEAFDAYLSAHWSSDEHTFSYELLVVDDGSTDGTVELVRSMQETMSSLRLVRMVQNGGKGAAVRRGMLEAKGSIRVLSDADGSTPPQELPALLRAIGERGVGVAIGSRYAPGAIVETEQPWLRRVWSRLVNVLVQFLLLPGIVDPQCGFKAFRAEVAEDIFPLCEVDGWAFDLEVLALARRRGAIIEEVPIRWADDARSRVKFSHLLREIGNVFNICARGLGPQCCVGARLGAQ